MKKLILILITITFLKTSNLNALNLKTDNKKPSNSSSSALVLGLTLPQAIGALTAGIVILILKATIGSAIEFKREANLTEFINNFLKEISENPKLKSAIENFDPQNLTETFEKIHTIINETIADQRLHSKLIGKEQRVLSPELADALTNKFNEFYDSIIKQVKESPTLNISQFLSNLKDISGVEVKTIDVKPILKKFGIIDETLIEKIQTTFNKNTTEVVTSIKQINHEANQQIIKERFTDIILRSEFKAAAEFAPQLQEMANEIGKSEYAAFYSDFLNKTVEEIIQNSNKSNSKARIYLNLFGKTSTPTKLHEDTYTEFASEIFLDFARNNSSVIDKLHQIILSGEYNGNEVQKFESEIKQYISNNEPKVKEILAKTYLSEYIAQKYLTVNKDLETNPKLQEKLTQEIIKKLKEVELGPKEVDQILKNMNNLDEESLQSLSQKDKIEKYFETMLDGVDTNALLDQLNKVEIFNAEGFHDDPIISPDYDLNPRFEDPLIIGEQIDPIYEGSEYSTTYKSSKNLIDFFKG